MEYVLHYSDVLFFDHVYGAAVNALRYGAALATGLELNCASATEGVVNTTAGTIGTLFNGGCPANYMPESTLLLTQLLPTSLHSTIPYLPDFTSRDNTYRQIISLYLITVTFGHLLYYSVASLSFRFIYDKNQLHHPRFLQNQIELEKGVAHKAMGPMAWVTVPWFYFQLHGHSKLYDRVDDYGWTWLLFSMAFFIFFTDMMIYWIHRGLHHRWAYTPLHKLHHKWIVPTPFASHAFYFMDGYLQSIPYHLFVYLFPLQKLVYLGLFGFVNVWTILIHDGEYFTDNPVINGAAHHTVHHEQFNYNYGQYFTLWDRIGGTYRAPEESVFNRKEMLKKMLAKNT
ncbi:hypothetical protein BDF19DRAFT_435777 [Syncephalis fuscata]|nr:hypothetical protein BDF19DRAFT_435777 [Syncephalis fuscata]